MNFFSKNVVSEAKSSPEVKSLVVSGNGASRGSGRRLRALRPKGKVPALRRPIRKKLSELTVGDAGSMALEAWRATRSILSMINVEHKYFDVLLTSALPDWNGTFANLSNITQGADVTNRDGDSVLMTRLDFRAVIYPGGTAQQNAVRFILFRDMEQDGVDPTIVQVVEPAALGAASAVIAPLTYFYAGPGTSRKRRFDILMDKTISVAIRGGSETVGFVEYSHEFRGGDKHIWYDATAGADASNREGMIGLILLSDNTGAGNVPTVEYYSRLIFTDD